MPRLLVADGTGVRTRRLGSDDEEAVAVEETRAAARRHRRDVELDMEFSFVMETVMYLRRLDRDAGGGRLERVIERAVVATHVRRRA